MEKMTREQREEIERGILTAIEQGDQSAAAQRAVEIYGEEISRWLVVELRDIHRAEEVLSDFYLKLFEKVLGFRGSSSFRTWAYRVARNARTDYVRKADNRPDLRVRLSNLPANISKLIVAQRESTVGYMQTAVKDRFVQLREHLKPEEQTLLILRVDRNLAWEEIAYILNDEPGDLEVGEVKKRAATLRQRFGRIKGKLREAAEREGLL